MVWGSIGVGSDGYLWASTMVGGPEIDVFGGIRGNRKQNHGRTHGTTREAIDWIVELASKARGRTKQTGDRRVGGFGGTANISWKKSSKTD